MRGGNVTQTANILNKTNRTRNIHPDFSRIPAEEQTSARCLGENKGLRASFIY